MRKTFVLLVAMVRLLLKTAGLNEALFVRMPLIITFPFTLAVVSRRSAWFDFTANPAAAETSNKQLLPIKIVVLPVKLPLGPMAIAPTLTVEGPLWLHTPLSVSRPSPTLLKP